jgi:hypothetical protein
MITDAKSNTQNQGAILHAIGGEVVAQLSLELSEEHKVLAHVSVKHTVYDQLPHVSLCFDWNVFEEIGIITIEHNLKSSR